MRDLFWHSLLIVILTKNIFLALISRDPHPSPPLEWETSSVFWEDPHTNQRNYKEVQFTLTDYSP